MNDIEMWGDWCSGWGPLCRQPQTIERVRDQTPGFTGIISDWMRKLRNSAATCFSVTA